MVALGHGNLHTNGKKGGDDKVTDFESERDSLEAKAKNVSEVEKIKEMGEHWEEKGECDQREGMKELEKDFNRLVGSFIEPSPVPLHSANVIGSKVI